MTWFNKHKARKWMRQLHRDIGLLMIGVALVYGLSGILLNHMDGSNPSYTTIKERFTLSQGLNKKTLKDKWQTLADVPPVKLVTKVDESHLRLLFDGGIGVYNAENGVVEYEFHKKRPLYYYVNKLHYNQVNGWTSMADIFAGSLIFLAISGILMLPLKGKKGRRRILLLVVGVLVPIAYLIFS